MAERATDILRTRLGLTPLNDTQLFFWLIDLVEKQQVFVSIMHGAALVRLDSTVWYTVLTRASDGALIAGDSHTELIESLCGCCLKALLKGGLIIEK